MGNLDLETLGPGNLDLLEIYSNLETRAPGYLDSTGLTLALKPRDLVTRLTPGASSGWFEIICEMDIC